MTAMSLNDTMPSETAHAASERWRSYDLHKCSSMVRVIT